jgi:hypothetical protein
MTSMSLYSSGNALAERPGLAQRRQVGLEPDAPVGFWLIASGNFLCV